MAIFPLFSKRQKLLRGEVPDIYIYDTIPKPLRVQVFYLLRECIGIYQNNYHSSRDQKVKDYYTTIHDILCKEYGYYQLANGYHPDEQVFNFLDQEQDAEKVLDLIEISFFLIDTVIRQEYPFYREAKINPDEAIAELNHRFQEHGIGYQYEAGKIIRVDSNYMHSEILKPTLKLIWNKKFAGSNEEYLKAHEHYRHGRNKECLVECLKAFESTMKTICSVKGWSYKKGTA